MLPVLADPNPGRLVGRQSARRDAARSKSRAAAARLPSCASRRAGGKGFWIAVDCTGQPGVWSDAIESVRPGGLVNLFGGCAPGTSIPLDTHLVHYSELTLKGVYHHRPDTFRRAIALLADPAFKADLLHLRHAADRRRGRRAAEHDAQGSAEGGDPERRSC